MASENNDTQDGEIKKGNHNSFEAQVREKRFPAANKPYWSANS